MADNKELAALVAKWREQANAAARRSGTWNGSDLADRIEWMADDLESALAATPSAQAGEVVAWVPPAMLDPRVMGNFYTASRFAVTPESIPLVRATTPQPQGDASPEVSEQMVERAWMAHTGRDKLGSAYADDAKCMTAEERRDIRAALTAALAPQQPTGEEE